MAASRTENVLKNSIITMICQVVHFMAGFVGRTFLTKILGSEYLGVNGLFANILTILSFAELGIGSTLVYHMYEPLVSDNKEKLCIYIQLYKKMYSVIIAIVSFVGLLFIPFLEYIVKAPNIEENLVCLYLFYLADTIISYAYVYKKSILIADQKSYVVSLFTQMFNIIMNVVQCIALVFTQSFILYIFIKIVCDLLNNIFCSEYAKKKYPYIIEKTKKKLDDKEKEGLKKDVKGLLFTKIASTSFGGTDNLFISSFIGIKYVGILSNYMMILNVVNSFMNNIFEAVTASVGNLNVLEDMKQTEKVLYRLFFINICIYGYFSIGIMLLIREFITEIWFNSEYFLSAATVAAAVLELFMRGIHYPIYTVRMSLGLFSEHKILFVVAAMLNVVLDFLFVKPFGITGLIFATIICRGICYIADIYVVYKIAFKKSAAVYYKKTALWMLYLFLICTVLYIICNSISVGGILGFVLKIIIITIFYVTIMVLVFRKNDDFLYFLNILLHIKEKLKVVKQ